MASSILLDMQVTVEDGRVVLIISRSDTGAVIRGFLNASQARNLAYELLRASLEVE